MIRDGIAEYQFLDLILTHEVTDAIQGRSKNEIAGSH